MTEIVEAEVVSDQEREQTATTDVVPANLFRTDDPAEVLRRANETADALMPVVRERGLIAKISGRDHLTVEAWQTLGAMLGVTPVCTWTRKLEDGWEARVEARTLDGRVIGAAEAECLRAEKEWGPNPTRGKPKDDFALRSMAQTRATSKALASVLRFVATLGGASGTPAEEMPRDAGGTVAISDKQRQFLERLLKDGGAPEGERVLILAYAAAELTGGRGGTASKAIDGLKGDDGPKAYNKLFKDARSWQAKQSDVPADDTDLPPAEPDEGSTLL